MTAHSRFKPSRSLQSCRNCDAFYHGAAAKRPGEAVQGFCHGGLPTFVHIMQQGHSLAANGPTLVPVSIPNVWPPVTSDQWCRHWQGEEDDGQSGTA